MSDNITIYATLTGYTKSGKEVVERSTFNVFQDPTLVTNKILENKDPIDAYKQWVLNTYNNDGCSTGYGSLHIQELNTWIDSLDDEWIIKIDMI